MMPPKLVELAGNYLVRPLSQSVEENSIKNREKTQTIITEAAAEAETINIEAVLINLSKAFDCTPPHDLVISKLAAYGFEKVSYATFTHTEKVENSMSA